MRVWVDRGNLITRGIIMTKLRLGILGDLIFQKASEFNKYGWLEEFLC